MRGLEHDPREVNRTRRRDSRKPDMIVSKGLLRQIEALKARMWRKRREQ